MNPTATTTIDFWPLIQTWILPALGTLITGALMLLANKALKKMGVEQDAVLAGQLKDALDRAVAYGIAKATAAGMDHAKIETQNTVVGTAASYILQLMPETLAKLGVTPDSLQQIITAHLFTPDAPNPTTVAATTPALAAAAKP